MKTKIVNFIFCYSYIIVALPLIILETIIISKGSWHHDFWEHSAVVNELSKHLLNPNNPIIKGNTPHAFFSPYSMMVAVFSKITNFNSIQSLEFFAFLNLIFFLFSFYIFCKNIFGENHNLLPSISLLFILFFWGKEPFIWSGFYHFMALQYVLSYPSTFAISLSLFILSIIAKSPDQIRFRNIFILVILNAIVFITHPTTGIFLFLSIATLYFSFNNNSLKMSLIKSSIVIFPGLMLCLIWPYYNFLDLLLGQNYDFNKASLAPYSRIVEINWPVLFIIPGLFLLRKNKILIFFYATIFLMLSVYGLGFMLKIYGVSRLISNIMMFSQIIIAYTIVIQIKQHCTSSKFYFLVIGITFATTLLLNFKPLLSASLYRVLAPKDIHYYAKYDFLRTYVKSDDIILSDSNSNWLIPSFNGKVLASRHALYWVDDIKERRFAVRSFFKEGYTDPFKLEIISKYHPDFLLINYQEVNLSISTQQWIKTLGQTVYNKDQLELIKINYRRSSNP